MKTGTACHLLAFVISMVLCLWSETVNAHFGVILPSEDIVEADASREVVVSCQFMHPFAQEFMEMARPSAFGFVIQKERKDLTGLLRPKTMGGHTVWEAVVSMSRPGDHVFFMVPEPYWEPAEQKFIQHVTKVVVNAFGREEGWGDPVGLRAEIVPLSRPYGLWTGQVFTGRVLFEGRPVPDVPVEVEYYNIGKKLHVPCTTCETQVLKTDQDGYFSFAMPKPGWWGFAALIDAPDKVAHEGKEYPLELGAVIWVRTRDVK